MCRYRSGLYGIGPGGAKVKKTLAIIISLILVVSCAAVHTSASEPILGDVNESGEVNSDDAIYLLRYVLFGDIYPVQGVTDFDGNGVLNSDDAIYLLRHVLFGDIYPLTHPAAFLASDRLANASKYLFRVGNANAVKLGTLFRAINDTPDPSKVNVTIEAVAPSDTTVSGVYNRNSSDWAQGTLKFSGEGPVKVTIAETGRAFDMYLEVIDGKNVTSYGEINASGVNVLLGDITLASGAHPIWSGAVYGNGFTIDASAGLTTQHGIITLSGAAVDNVVINGPLFDTYVASFGETYYTATVYCSGEGSTITNSRITGAQSPLKINSDTLVRDTVLSGGFFCNLEARGGSITLEDVTTVNTQNSLGVVIAFAASATTALTLTGDLIQHNFISSSTDLGNSNANLLRNVMFRSAYSQYHFVSGSEKYVNTGIISMNPDIGGESIIDKRSDKRNYYGMVATILGQNGYVYTMDNTDPSALETSYAEPAYKPSVQKPYEPAFSWALPASETVQPGGSSHCYTDSNGVLQIRFTEGESKTLHVSQFATIKKYGKKVISSYVMCKNTETGKAVPISSGNVTFSAAGVYELTYTYTDNFIFDKDGVDNSDTVKYTKSVRVNVMAVKDAPDAAITSSADTGALVWATAGTVFDVDYHPCAPLFAGLTINDYDSDNNAYTVLDGSNLASFIGSLSSVTVSGKTVTFRLKNGTKLVVVCTGNIDGSMQIKLKDNVIYCCDSTADNNRNTVSLRFASYTYTGENGVEVAYTSVRTFTGSTDGATIGAYRDLTALEGTVSN